MQRVLELQNLGKQYKDFLAVKNVNMNIKKGDIYGFLGKNGAGKTTTIRMIMQLIQKSEGDVFLFGKKNSTDFSRISATIEYPGFYTNLTAKENLEYYAKMQNISEKRVDEVLEIFGLTAYTTRLAKDFSLGMKQRLGLARALLNSPELLILDEPTNGLDPAGIQEIRQTIIRLNKEHGITILFSSHILSEVEQIATRIGIINKGSMIDEFTLEDFRKNNNSCIDIKVDDTEKALLCLKSDFQVTNYKIEKDTIKIFEKIDNTAKVNQALISNNIQVYSLHEVSETLEEYFMKITRE